MSLEAEIILSRENPKCIGWAIARYTIAHKMRRSVALKLLGMSEKERGGLELRLRDPGRKRLDRYAAVLAREHGCRAFWLLAMLRAAENPSLNSASASTWRGPIEGATFPNFPHPCDAAPLEPSIPPVLPHSGFPRPRTVHRFFLRCSEQIRKSAGTVVAALWRR